MDGPASDVARTRLSGPRVSVAWVPMSIGATLGGLLPG